jgi:hypothetical protein
VRGVVRCLAPRRRSSSSLSPRLLCAFFPRKVLRLSIRKEEGGGWIFSLHPFFLLQNTFDNSSYSKKLWKCRNNYDILKTYIMIKHVIVK